MGNILPGVFLEIVNMSITAAYVALAVIIIRLALKKAPKAVSYALWLVVLFRLVCPVSFSSPVSLMRMGNVAPAAQQGASVTYIQTPAAAYHAPAVAAAATAAPANTTSVSAPSAAAVPSPVETLLLIAAAVWAAGVAVMLVLSVVSHIRLKRRISDATLLYDNIYETDAIQSPFVMGIFRPRIYLPSGMDSGDMEYVLRHEHMHIQRRDNVVKPLAYAVLCLHWFNPLVWAAFYLMCADMEMSCDEKVLRGMGERDKACYGEALLKLSTNRRLLAGSPLAFGETPVKSRIKNVLKFKKPVFWIAAVAVVAAAVVGICLIANPSGAASASTENLYGNYKFEKQVYMCPLSSFLALDGYEQYYMLNGDTLTITEASGEQQSIPVTYERKDANEQDFDASFMSFGDSNIGGKPDISQYKQRCQYTLRAPAEYVKGYRLYLMDDEVWLAELRYNGKLNGTNNEYIWSIYKIAKYGGELPQLSGTDTENGVNMHISGTKDGVDGFESAHGYDSGYEDDECYNITPQYIQKNSDYTIFKYDKSCESFLLYQGEVYELGVGFGGYGVVSMTLADLNEDTEPELYFTSSWGSGVHRSQAGYFDPSQKKVVVFDYSNFNADMLVANNSESGLSLYAAEITDMSSFVSLTAESAGYIADIVYSDGDIVMAEPQEAGQPQPQGSAPAVTSSAAPESLAENTIYSFDMPAHGDLFTGVATSDKDTIKAIKDAIATLSSATNKAVDISKVENYITLTVSSNETGKEEYYTYYVFEKDGRYCIQDTRQGLYSYISEDAYNVIAKTAKEIYESASPSQTTDPTKMPRNVEISMYIGGDSDLGGVPIEDNALLQLAEDVVIKHMFSSAAWEGVDIRTLDSYLCLNGQFAGHEEPESFYIYEKDGKYCIQKSPKGMYSIIDKAAYYELLDTALGYGSAGTMTIATGDNSVYALENTITTDIDTMHGDFPRLKPEQVAKYLQYLSIDADKGGLTPFTPYLNGEKAYGTYKLYDSDFNEIPVIQPSGLEPQAFLFANAPGPGTYIVELEATSKIYGTESKSQYFFGVMLTEE